MRQERQWFFDADEEAANRQTASLGGVAIILVLLIVGLLLVHALHAKATIEDCLLSGRTNCNQLLTNTPGSYPPPTH